MGSLTQNRIEQIITKWEADERSNLVIDGVPKKSIERLASKLTVEFFKPNEPLLLQHSDDDKPKRATQRAR